MSYKHGISILENNTPIVPPKQGSSGVQVIIGTAPINLVENKSVNEPLLVFSYSEAIAKLGYSNSFDKFTLCQSIDASFKVFNVAPIILINVLDPAKHKTIVSAKTVVISNKLAIEEIEGILLDTLVVKNEAGSTTYIKDTDYSLRFNEFGFLEIEAIADGAAEIETEFTINYSHLDVSKVTNLDVIGAYDQATNSYSGIEIVSQVYPRLSIIPGQILAPGFSHIKEIARALELKSRNINGCFNAVSLLDLDCSKLDYTEVPIWKTDNNYTNKDSLVFYPKGKIGNKTYYLSALVAALNQSLDIAEDNVPCSSPSNKKLPLTTTVLENGDEIYLDQLQANFLNAAGIITAINLSGWKCWGNNTAGYPDTTDVKDRFIVVRRMFDYFGNEFVLSYFSKVDNPMDSRLIESVVDNENLKSNALQAQGKIASAKIEYRVEDNPTTQVLSGKIQFLQKIAIYTPAESIVNVLEFDPNALMASLGGN